MPITGLSPRSRAAMLGSTLLRQAPLVVRRHQEILLVGIGRRGICPGTILLGVIADGRTQCFPLRIADTLPG